MSSTQITGGSVKYTEPSNYTSGKSGCEVTIHFTVSEGDGQMASVMGDTAYCEAMRLATGKLSLGGPLAAMRSAPPAQPAPTGDTLIGAASPVIGADPGSTIHAPTAAASPNSGVMSGPIATPAASPSEAVMVIGYPSTHPQSGVASTGMPAPGVIGTSTGPIATTAASPSETIGANGHDAGISDLDLRGAVERKLAQFDPGKDADAISRQRGPIAVAQLLAQYVTPPAKVYALSPEQRPEFVAKLAALTLT